MQKNETTSSTPTVQQEEQQVVELPKTDMSLPTQANMYYVKLDDGWVEGKLIGCNDSLISVPVLLDTLFTSREEVLTYVYKMQLWAKGQPENLATTLTPALQVASISVADGKAAVALSGTILLWGSCDVPRVQEQLTAVGTQFPEITEVAITINGTPLDDYLSSK